MLKKISDTQVRRIARHLVQFPFPERTKILSSYPSEDKVRISEEIKRIKDDSSQYS
jgi:hypothetical protein